MIKANDLDGRAVIDLETAKKLGYVDEIYLDTDGARIAALRVSEGSTLTGGGNKMVVPMSAVETIGPEAIMVRPTRDGHADQGPLNSLPRLSHIVGRKVVSEGGKLLGTIDGVMLDGSDGRIGGYSLKSGSWTDSLFGTSDTRSRYVRGDASLRLGEDLMVVPDDAIVAGDVEHDARSSDDRSSVDALSTTPRSATRVTERDDPARTEHLDDAEPLARGEPVARSEPPEHWDDESLSAIERLGGRRTTAPDEPVTDSEHLATRSSADDRPADSRRTLL